MDLRRGDKAESAILEVLSLINGGKVAALFAGYLAFSEFAALWGFCGNTPVTQHTCGFKDCALGLKSLFQIQLWRLNSKLESAGGEGSFQSIPPFFKSLTVQPASFSFLPQKHDQVSSRLELI